MFPGPIALDRRLGADMLSDGFDAMPITFSIARSFELKNGASCSYGRELLESSCFRPKCFDDVWPVECGLNHLKCSGTGNGFNCRCSIFGKTKHIQCFQGFWQTRCDGLICDEKLIRSRSDAISSRAPGEFQSFPHSFIRCWLGALIKPSAVFRTSNVSSQ